MGDGPVVRGVLPTAMRPSGIVPLPHSDVAGAQLSDLVGLVHVTGPAAPLRALLADDQLQYNNLHLPWSNRRRPQSSSHAVR